MFQRFVPDDDLFDEVYGRWIDHGPTAGAIALKGFEVRRQYAFQVINVVKHFRRNPDEIRMLDFGMGWANWVQMAAAFGCAVEGAESNPVQLESAHRRDLTTVSPDALEPERYDFINTEQVFEHLVDPLSLGRRLVGALRPGGVLRISVPNGTHVPALLEKPNWTAPKGHPQSLNAITPLEHLNTFTHESLNRLGAQLGLQPFTFPLRVYLDQWQPIRGVLGSLVRRVRPASGTLLYFERSR